MTVNWFFIKYQKWRKTSNETYFHCLAPRSTKRLTQYPFQNDSNSMHGFITFKSCKLGQTKSFKQKSFRNSLMPKPFLVWNFFNLMYATYSNTLTHGCTSYLLSTAQHGTPWHTTAHHVTPQHTMSQHSTPCHSTAQHTMSCHTTPHHTTPHHTTPHHTTPHRTTPHHTAPHRTTPHHTAPHTHRALFDFLQYQFNSYKLVSLFQE